YKRGSTLKDILCPAESKEVKRMDRIFKSSPNIGTFPCLNCICCHSIIKGGVVQHPTKGFNIKLQHFATCNTECVVYMLKCPCGKTYRAIKERIKEHRGNIKNFKANTDTPVSRHFNQNRHSMSQLKWLVLDVIQRPRRGGDIKKLLLQREAIWIKKLCALDPLGLNDKWSIACFL
ncbi:hypothetical protein XELAEV_18031894mg, partial [Xenopus laevis]